MEKEEDILKILKFLGDSIVTDMRVLIELNGSIATGRLHDNIRIAAKKLEGKYTLVLSYPFYGKYVDEGRKPGKMPPVQDIRDWCRLKGIPQSAAFPIAKKIGEKGFKGIHFTKPYYDDITVIKDILTDQYKDYVLKVLMKDLK
jgi:hypothetical protein